MIRPQAKLDDILGKKEPCYFSINGINHFKYGECRNCLNYNIRCSNYISSRKSPSVEKSVEIQNYEPSNGVVVKDNRMPSTVDYFSTHSDSYTHQQTQKDFKKVNTVVNTELDGGRSLPQKDKTVDEIILRNENQIKKNDKILNRPFFWYHSSIHEPILPRRNYRTIIRGKNGNL